MKVNYVLHGLKLTGGVRVIVEIANRLAERGHQVSVTAVGRLSDLAWFENPKFKVYLVHDPYWKKVVRRGLKLIKYDYDLAATVMRRLAETIPAYCEINVATHCFTAFAVHRSGKGIPFYHMQHYEPLFYEYDPYYQKVAMESYLLPLNRIANSRWLQQQLLDKHNIKCVELVHPAIDHTIFKPPVTPARRGNGQVTVLSLGKPDPIKGFRDALAAMRIVQSKYSNVDFVVFGTNPNLPVEKGVQYRFVKSPVNEELARLYQQADILISASWYESFPLPPLEAMACGTAVVTTRFGTEDYAFDRQNCLVVPPRAPERLADAVCELIEDEQLRHSLASEGIETARKFTWEKTVDKVERLFSKYIDASH